MVLVRESVFPATLAQDESAENLQPLPTPPQIWAARQETLSIGNVKLRRRKLGGLCWLATAPRPDFRPRLAHIASGVNSLQGSDVNRIHDLGKTVKA